MIRLNVDNLPCNKHVSRKKNGFFIEKLVMQYDFKNEFNSSHSSLQNHSYNQSLYIKLAECQGPSKNGANVKIKKRSFLISAPKRQTVDIKTHNYFKLKIKLLFFFYFNTENCFVGSNICFTFT